MGGVREKTVDKQGKTCIIVFVRQDTAGLCKGSTADSDSVCEGSNPSPAATIGASVKRLLRFFLALCQRLGKEISWLCSCFFAEQAI